MPTHPIEQTDEVDLPEPSAMPRSRRSAVLFLLAGLFAAAATLALGLLNLFGVGTGLLVNAGSALLLVLAFVFSIKEALDKQLKNVSSRRRKLYVTGIVAVAVALLIAGLGTRKIAPLPRMGGTSDVAVLGFRAPSKQTQQRFDDVAASLTKALPGLPDGEVRNYSREVDAPLEELQNPTRGLAFEQWLSEFLAESDAEFVVAGFAEFRPHAQMSVKTLVYVPVRMAADAPELAGWYVLADDLLDGELESGIERRTFIQRVGGELGGLAAFLNGLDAWHAGYPTEAVEAFSQVIDDPAERQSTSNTLPDLARLFRGHAHETRALVSEPQERERLLKLARIDYAQVAGTSTIAIRARLSTATNDYLWAARSGCARGSVDEGALARSSASLGAIAGDGGQPEIIQIKAKVNRAQVEQCRLEARPSRSDRTLVTLLEQLAALRISPDDVQVVGKRQVKALALSISATRLAGTNQLDSAISTMQQALGLDGRFERQALWLGLQSSWLLATCRIEAGAAAQQESLAQLGRAVERLRLPASDLKAYGAAFAEDLAAARQQCTGPQQNR